MALPIPTIQATKADVTKAAKELFSFRQSMATDSDPRTRHPMMYKGYTWSSLPASERTYYCDMVSAVFLSFGVKPATVVETESA